MNLPEGMTDSLLRAGLDSIVFSIDGFSAKTQESIRKMSSLEKIISNIDYFITQREVLKARTSISIRFTQQDENKAEWPDFLNFWKGLLNAKYNDSVCCYDIHNAGSSVKTQGSEAGSKKAIKCSVVYKRMIIFSDGEIGLCCGDQFGHYNIGNILNKDPIALYNHPIFKEYRQGMDEGRIFDLELCRDCTVMFSINNKKQIFV
jgi:hypothetical protein